MMWPFFFHIIPYIIAAYLIGSISMSYIIGKKIYNVDISKQGSGNAGATNVTRVLGLKAGIFVLAFDIFKGWISVHLVDIFPLHGYSEKNILIVQFLLAFAVIAGHIFPVFNRFKGGKGVATIVGVIIVLYSYEILFIELALFILIFIFTRYVSLSVLVCSFLLPFLFLWLMPFNQILLFFSFFVAIFIPVTHIDNIKRLYHGRENQLKFKKNN